jgi:acyl-CoA thioesterase-1
MEPAPGAERLQKTFGKLRVGREVTLVALGDSITFGTKVPQDMRTDGLYFQLVALGLESAFPGAKVRAVNAGAGGDTIAEGLVRIGRDAAVHNPDLVIVLLGANDAIYRFPESRVVSTMALLVDTVRAATDAEVLLLGPAPCGEAPGVAERYAQALASLAGDKKVAYLNLSDHMRNLARKDYEAAYDKDRVHWSQSGHKVVGELVLNHVLHLQDPPAKPGVETGKPQTE